MPMDVDPEPERFVGEEIRRGHSGSDSPGAENFFDLFAPVRGLLTDSEIDAYFQRDSSPGRAVDLG